MIERSRRVEGEAGIRIREVVLVLIFFLFFSFLLSFLYLLYTLLFTFHFLFLLFWVLYMINVYVTLVCRKRCMYEHMHVISCLRTHFLTCFLLHVLLKLSTLPTQRHLSIYTQASLSPSTHRVTQVYTSILTFTQHVNTLL